ncbi:unnamed protein product [Gordionus sp. m RMFG-2023]
MESWVNINVTQNYSIANFYQYHCLNWKILTKQRDEIKYLFEVIAPILWAFGTAGNIIGLIVSFSESPYPAVILTRIYYSVGVLNCAVMLLYPIMDLIGEFNDLPFFSRATWKHYIADYHFPIARALTHLSLGVYVIYILSQALAILYPFLFRNHFTTRRIVIIILIYYAYVQIWFYPIKYWFTVIEVKDTCGSDINSTRYVNKFMTTKELNSTSWKIYSIFRVFFTNFIPILSIIVFKLCLLKRKRKIMSQRYSFMTVSSTNQNHVIYGKTLTKFDNTFKSDIIHDGNVNNINNDELKFDRSLNRSKLRVPIEPINLYQINKIAKRRRDHHMDIRMLAIMTLQYIIFLLPATIFVMTIGYFILLTPKNINVILGISTFLEYLYISLTFYLNLIFNPNYRLVVKMGMKKLVSKILK